MAGIVMLLGGVLGSAAMGGYTAYNSQRELQQNICDYVQLMKNYQDSMNTEYTGLSIQIVNMKKKVSGIQGIITSKQQDLKDAKTKFKRLYNMTILFGIIFLCIVIFLLGTKRFILKR